MVEPNKYKYYLYLVTEKKKHYDISGLVENLSWEEPENELAARITFYAKNDKTSKGRLSSLAKPGCYVYVMFAYNSGKKKEAVRGRVVEWNPSAKASMERLKIKAYDDLYNLQESYDNIYYSAVIRTKTAITQILGNWNVKVGRYDGPDVSHGKLVYKNEKISSILLKILAEAKKKGSKKCVLRSKEGKVQVLPYGHNEKIYHFAERENLLSSSHKVSTVGMVTRVKVVGKENDEGRSPVEAVLDGKTEYGIRQKIVTRGSDESLDDAKKSAQDILDEDGDTDKERRIKAPDMPMIRKGHIIHVKSSTGTGYFHVMGISHNCDSMTMELTIKKTRLAAGETSKKGGKNNRQEDYQVGDIVNFHGGKHYVSSYPGAVGYSVAPGKAKITGVNGAGKAHPWLLVTEDWSQTHVWGWVDDGTFD